MGMPWFRMYHEFATDPKVQMLSESMQRRYVMILCLRCCNDNVTLQDEEVAFQLRLSNDEWLETKSVLMSKNLITEHNVPASWDKRQMSSDSSAERVRKHRTQKKRYSNVTETKCNAIEVEVDKEVEVEVDKIKPKTFVRPTLQEVTEYCNTRGKGVDPEAWMDHYTSNGFKVGKNSMKNWKSACRQWERNDIGKGKDKTKTTKERIIDGFKAKGENRGLLDFTTDSEEPVGTKDAPIRLLPSS